MTTNPLIPKKSDTDLEIQHQDYLSNSLNYIIGLGIMAANKIRHEFQGYKSARGFSTSEMERAIKYDFNIVKRWMDYLNKYEYGSANFANKNILELGPGADLGIGLICLAMGANNYHSLDVHNLIESAPATFYDKLFKHFETLGYSTENVAELKNQLKKFNQGKPEELNYQVQKDFDLSVFEGKKFDVVVSNSAFQQFDDPFKTIQQMSELVNPGGTFVALIDLSTHTRFIKGRDPLNIYRYPEQLYNAFKFSGSPNRVRPFQFKQALEKNGWSNVKIFSRLQLKWDYIEKVKHTLDARFRDPENNMECLTAIICATKE